MGMLIEEREELCVRWRRKRSLKTQTVRRERKEIDPATRTWDYFQDLKGRTEGDAKMR